MGFNPFCSSWKSRFLPTSRHFLWWSYLCWSATANSGFTLKPSIIPDYLLILDFLTLPVDKKLFHGIVAIICWVLLKVGIFSSILENYGVSLPWSEISWHWKPNLFALHAVDSSITQCSIGFNLNAAKYVWLKQMCNADVAWSWLIGKYCMIA